MNLEKTLRYIVLTGVFALPFVVTIVWATFFFPYVVGKNFTFRIIIEIIFGAWVLLALLNAEYRPRLNVLLISVIAFVGIVALADVLGENFYKSFWSNFERMEGLVTLLHLLAYVIVAGTVMVKEELWLWFWRISLGISFFIALHTFVQSLSSDSIRLFSTLGNPIYLAVYALFHVFIALLLSARDGATRNERLLYMAVLVTQLIALYLTATRGATLGLVIGLFITGCGILYSYRSEKRSRTIAVVGIAILVLVIGSFGLARNSDFVQGNGTLKRFSNLSLSDSTVFARTVIWGMAWEGVKEKPILGWGQENFNLAFAKYYDPRMYAQEQWFDRTHNVVFDWLIASGVLGLLAYISIFLSLLWCLYKSVHFNAVQKWLFVGLLVAYGLSNLTVFDTITSYILFFSIIVWVYASAFYSSNVREESSLRVPEISNKMGLLIGAPAIVVFSIVLFWFVNVGPMQVSKGIITALQKDSRAQFLAQKGLSEEAIATSRESLGIFKELDAKGTYGTQELRELLATTAGNRARADWLPDEVKEEWYVAAREAMVNQNLAAPQDPRFPFFLANLHDAYGNKLEFWKWMSRAAELSPNKQSILLQLGTMAANERNFDIAIAITKDAFELEPSYIAARTLYAFTLVRAGEYEKADKIMEGYPEVSSDFRILSAYIKIEDYEKAKSLWKIGIPDNENNRNRMFILAATYIQLGDLDRARSEIKYVMENYPSMRENGEQLLKQIQR